MPGINKTRSGISNSIFAIAVIFLLILAASGFGLYFSRIGSAGAMTEVVTQTVPATTTELMNHTVVTTMNHTVMSSASEPMNSANAYSFSPRSGEMITNAWLLVASINMDQYAVSIHAEGLEPNGTYIVEGQLTNGSMQTVPISSESMTMNTTIASEFRADSNGTGLFWILIDHNSSATFETIDLYFLPGMSMQNSTLVASVSFPGMSTMNETSSST